MGSVLLGYEPWAGEITSNRGGALVASAVPLLWNYFLKDYQKQRLVAPYDASVDPDGWGIRWQTTQSKMSLASGRLTGVDDEHSTTVFTGKHQNVDCNQCHISKDWAEKIKKSKHLQSKYFCRSFLNNALITSWTRPMTILSVLVTKENFSITFR